MTLPKGRRHPLGAKYRCHGPLPCRTEQLRSSQHLVGQHLIRQTAGIPRNYRDHGPRHPKLRGTTDMPPAITDQTTYWDHYAEGVADQPLAEALKDAFG